MCVSCPLSLYQIFNKLLFGKHKYQGGHLVPGNKGEKLRFAPVP